MEVELGPLPEPSANLAWDHSPKGTRLAEPWGYGTSTIAHYTAAQMRAYAQQEVAKERERCAKLCEDSDTYQEDDPGGFFAMLIRNGTE